MWIFVALIVVPIVEIALFIEIGGLLGLWPTIAVVILTAIAGGMLLRQQGLATLRGLQAQMARGADPSPLLVQGALILVAGVVLLTPGFFTDAVGLLLLIPQSRAALVAWAGPRIAARIVTVQTGPPSPGPRPHGGDETIDADYRDVSDNPGNGRR